MLVLDECTISHNRAIEELNFTMRNIKCSQSIMEEMVAFIAGDFRLSLALIFRGTTADDMCIFIMGACKKNLV